MDKPVDIHEWLGTVQTVILSEGLVPRTAADVFVKAVRQSLAPLKLSELDQQAFEFVAHHGRRQKKPEWMEETKVSG